MEKVSEAEIVEGWKVEANNVTLPESELTRKFYNSSAGGGSSS